MEIPKINSKTVLYFFIELYSILRIMVVILWKTHNQNMLYAIILFIGYNILSNV